METMLTETQVETLWQNAAGNAFLADMCEGWLDAHDSPATRERDGKIIRSYVKGSRVGALVGL